MNVGYLHVRNIVKHISNTVQDVTDGQRNYKMITRWSESKFNQVDLQYHRTASESMFLLCSILNLILCSTLHINYQTGNSLLNHQKKKKWSPQFLMSDEGYNDHYISKNVDYCYEKQQRVIVNVEWDILWGQNNCCALRQIFIIWTVMFTHRQILSLFHFWFFLEQYFSSSSFLLTNGC